MKHLATGVLLLSLALALVASAFGTTSVKAATQSFTLYGSATVGSNGWGFSNATIAQPGPTLTVNQGDSVTITIWAHDTMPHTWFLDKDNSGSWNSGEPTTAEINTTVLTASVTFTADTAGTFTYRCGVHTTTMTGSFVVNAPGGGTTPSGDNTLLYAGIGIVVVIVIVAIAVVMMRRGKRSGQQPPQQP